MQQGMDAEHEPPWTGLRRLAKTLIRERSA